MLEGVVVELPPEQYDAAMAAIARAREALAVFNYWATERKEGNDNEGIKETDKHFMVSAVRDVHGKGERHLLGLQSTAGRRTKAKRSNRGKVDSVPLLQP